MNLKNEIISQKSMAKDDVSVYINLAKNCVDSTYKKILQKLKTDKLNHFIKKNSKTFVLFLEDLIEEVFEIISNEFGDDNLFEDFEDYKEQFLDFKTDILCQWNNEAIIQKHLKKREVIRILTVNFMIGLILTIIGIAVNHFINGAKQSNIIQREIQITPSSIVEKIQSSPEVKKEASYFYQLLKDLDEGKLGAFLRALYAKLN